MLGTSKRIDPRATRTRALILTAFRDVMGAKAFDEITMENIASHATVNRATIYAHYPDKFAILDDLVRTEFEYLFVQRLPGNPTTLSALLRGLLLAFVEHGTRTTRRCYSKYKHLDDIVEGQIKAQLRDCIHDWMSTHLAASAPQGQRMMVATLLSWSLYGAAVEWLAGPRDQSPETYAEAVIPLLLPMATVLEA